MAPGGEKSGIDTGAGGHDHAGFRELSLGNGICGEGRTENYTANLVGRDILRDPVETVRNAFEQIGMDGWNFGLPENVVLPDQDHIRVSSSDIESYNHAIPLSDGGSMAKKQRLTHSADADRKRNSGAEMLTERADAVNVSIQKIDGLAKGRTSLGLFGQGRYNPADLCWWAWLGPAGVRGNRLKWFDLFLSAVLSKG
jgi:hypothetical protein